MTPRAWTEGISYNHVPDAQLFCGSKPLGGRPQSGKGVRFSIFMAAKGCAPVTEGKLTFKLLTLT